ncbi:hypothetical protein D0869_00276 [Hortaea werneckii]|uniref:Uncharacterized protein n=1 Tax=Hortaea werneckii TaxID=91943 RepID=A0A3M6XH93_HORWE|nr:hypothetical protein KC324_g521 [Hortaea werneckii]KAI7595571.1 hypothetical protein KC316_g451 [Hortaea werneckii]RMX90213.1 hypothetical protein D0869_00276 [Hortaea werneckii]RMY07680.1 hypothetical protein D0868_05223 [Hortaea werneckii]
MKTFATAAGMALGASAALLPRADQCCFQLTASGGASGTLGQLSDGQNRIGGGLGEATYCISNGMITDKSGRGCILTPPTTQFQCDKGASPDGGFSVGSGGNLQHNGDSTFYACPADTGEYNIYTQKVDGQSKCVKVTLNAGGKCAAGMTSSQAMTTSTAMSTSPAMSQQTTTMTVTQSKTCPSPQTITKTETKMEQNTEYKPTTIYKTETQTEQNTEYKPTTVYQKETQTQQNTQYKPTTIYQTETQTVQNTQVVPTTVYSTKTEEQTETATKQTTVYETKTQQETVTAEQPTTVYKTKTVEETETAKKPVTQYVTKVETQQYCPSTQATSMGTQTMGTQTMNTQSMPTQTKPASTSQSSACPTDLSGKYQYPHLIVPISSEHPDQSYGTSYNGQINGTTSSVYNFDIPQSYEGQTCSLVFLFPKKSDLETSDFTFNGEGSISVDHLSSAAMQSTTYNSCPKSAEHAGDFSPMPGNSYVVSTGDCAAGTTQSYELSASGGLSLEYFQDYNPSPIGLYITTC